MHYFPVSDIVQKVLYTKHCKRTVISTHLTETIFCQVRISFIIVCNYLIIQIYFSFISVYLYFFNIFSNFILTNSILSVTISTTNKELTSSYKTIEREVQTTGNII